jgi:hypothetical protein
MDAACDEPGMAVDADTVGLEDLDLNTPGFLQIER